MKKKANKWAAKLTAFLLAGAVFLGAAATVPSTVQAAGTNPLIQTQTTGSLTITKHRADDTTTLEGAEFSVYKIMSLTPGDTAGKFAKYEIVEAFEDVFKNKNVTPDALGNYSSTSLEALISDLKAEVEREGTTVTAAGTETTDANGIAKFEDLPLGYYLVIESSTPEVYVAGSPFLIAIPSTDNYNNAEAAGTTWVYDVAAEPKNGQVSIDKKLADAEDGAEQDGSVAAGDFVKYMVTTTIPNYPEKYFTDDVTFTLTDKMSVGLEIAAGDNAHPITVKVGGAAATAGPNTYTVTTKTKAEIAAAADLNDLTVAFVKDYIKANKGKAVELTYYAKVTGNAVTGTTGNPNKVTLTYSHQPGQTTTVESKEVKVYSFNINVVKFTNVDGPKALENAKFELYSDAALTAKIGEEKQTDTNGSLSFEKLDEGVYYLKEIEAPKGYTLLANPIKVEITAAETDGIATGRFTLKVNDKEITAASGPYVSYQDQAAGTAYIAVENNPGFTLPTTGGMGITIFLLTGAAGILLLSVMMTRKTKKNA